MGRLAAIAVGVLLDTARFVQAQLPETGDRSSRALTDECNLLDGAKHRQNGDSGPVESSVRKATCGGSIDVDHASVRAGPGGAADVTSFRTAAWTVTDLSVSPATLTENSDR